MTGHYIALEGGEGAGKTTLATAVAEHLGAAGHEVVRVREPGGTSLGEEIRRLLLHGDHMDLRTEALLFAAQRAELVTRVVGPALARGAWVVSDRSYYSFLAYQGGAGRLGVEAVRAINEFAVGDVRPDLVVVLLVAPTDGLARQDDADRIGGRDTRFAAAVAATYADLIAEDPGRVVGVDSSREPAEVANAVMAEIARRFQV